jgi:hypothetical protein
MVFETHCGNRIRIIFEEIIGANRLFKEEGSMKGIQFLIRGFIATSIFLFSVHVWATDFTATITSSDTFTVASSPLGGVGGCGIVAGIHTYSADPLLIDTSGTYTFMASGEYTGDFDDPFMAVYSPTFNADNPTANLVACNDDYDAHPVDDLFPRFSANLNAGYSYVIVTTTYGTGSNTGTVDFTITPDVTLLDPGDGQCGSADGTTVTSAPSGNALCDAGTPSTVTDTGTNYTWTCYGVGYNVSNDSCSATKGKSDQTITFGSLTSKTYGDDPLNLTATASSGLAVSYSSSNTEAATISGATVTIVGVGSTTITASQAGNASYNPASSVQQTLTVNAKGLTVSGAAASDKVYDKTTAATITGGSLVGVVSGDVVSLHGQRHSSSWCFEARTEFYRKAIFTGSFGTQGAGGSG